MPTKFSKEQVLEMAVMALDINKGSVERQAVKVPGLEIVPNRVLVEMGLEGKLLLIPTQDQKQRASELINYLQQVKIIQTLRGETNHGFLDSVMSLLEKSEIDRRDLGLIVWAPKLAQDYNKREKERQQISDLRTYSKYIGKIGLPVTINFTLLSYKQSGHTGNYIVTGCDETENLVSFWTARRENIHSKCQLRGRVKGHRESEYHQQAKITHLNYVKILKDSNEK